MQTSSLESALSRLEPRATEQAAGAGDDFVTALGTDRPASAPNEPRSGMAVLPRELLADEVVSRLDPESRRNLSLVNREVRSIVANKLLTELRAKGWLDPTKLNYGGAMLRLGPYSDALDRRGFITEALTVPKEQVRAFALGRIVQAFGTKLNNEELNELLTGTKAVRDPAARARALSSFSPHIDKTPPDFQLDWATAVRALPQSSQRMLATGATKKLTQEAKTALIHPNASPAERFSLQQIRTASG